MPLVETVPASMAEEQPDVRRLARRIRSEYLEMPGLCLTLAQACRLWGLDRRTCRSVVDRLVTSGFLAVSERGTYVRRDD
jgi:hypothetical protein